METADAYNSVFDAVRSIDPSSPLIQLGAPNARFFTRTNDYQLIDMQDGTIGAFPGMIPIQLFRGESKIYDTCKASIYRSDNPDDVIVDELRILEFKQIISTFPQVHYALEDHMKVDYLALAQHYELKTRLIDLTSAIEVAAYFATQHWEKGIPKPVESGIGCIRGILSPLFSPDTMKPDGTINPKYHMIGLQCFERPGLQAAYGLELDRDEDLNEMGWKIYFKQNAEASRIIHQNFHIDQLKVNALRATGVSGTVRPEQVESEAGWLFPKEEIADVANIIKNSKTICKAAVEEYGRPVAETLKRKRITVTEWPVYELTDARKIELEKQYKGRPYGNVALKARFCYSKVGLNRQV